MPSIPSTGKKEWAPLRRNLKAGGHTPGSRIKKELQQQEKEKALAGEKESDLAGARKEETQEN